VSLSTPAKISDLQGTIVRDQQVFWLDVTMYHAKLMQVLESKAEMSSPGPHIVLRDVAARLCADIVQQAELAELHAEEHASVLLIGVAELHNVPAPECLCSSAHGIDFRLDLFLDATDCKVLAAHDLNRERLACTALRDSKNLCEGTTAKETF